MCFTIGKLFVLNRDLIIRTSESQESLNAYFISEKNTFLKAKSHKTYKNNRFMFILFFSQLNKTCEPSHR